MLYRPITSQALPMKDMIRRVVPRSLWERMRQWRITSELSRFQRTVREHQYGNERFKVVLADGLSKGWYDRDWPVQTEMELLAGSRLTPGARVFDLGAHQGIVAMMMSRIVQDDGTIIAVEGMTHNCRIMHENLALNAIGNVVVRNNVVAAQTGRHQFFNGLNGCVARDGVGEWIDGITIDTLTHEVGSPQVVFVDIEGFEEQALEGARDTLSLACDWFVEVHTGCGLEEYGGSVQKVLAFFPPDKFDRKTWVLDSDDTPKALDNDLDAPGRRFGLVAIRR